MRFKHCTILRRRNEIAQHLFCLRACERNNACIQHVPQRATVLDWLAHARQRHSEHANATMSRRARWPVRAATAITHARTRARKTNLFSHCCLLTSGDGNRSSELSLDMWDTATLARKCCVHTKRRHLLCITPGPPPAFNTATRPGCVADALILAAADDVLGRATRPPVVITKELKSTQERFRSGIRTIQSCVDRIRVVRCRR
jgi:hypothetical protein